MRVYGVSAIAADKPGLTAPGAAASFTETARSRAYTEEDAMSSRQDDINTARRKGWVAAAATGGAVVLGVAASPVLGIVAAVPAAYFGWNWFQYRAKRGMKF